MEGLRAHQKIQQSRPPDYTPEVSVTHQVETDAVILSVSGRIDGVFGDSGNSNGRIVIDEIKSTRRDLATLRVAQNPLHWGQAKIYAYLYARAHNYDEIDVQLTYFQIDTGELFEIRQTWARVDLAAFFKEIVDRYLKWAHLIAQWTKVRSDSVKRVAFPFEVFRPGQRRMAVNVYKAIKAGDQLFIQAATGIGKTMAAIFPALKAQGEGLTEKIFFLTARTTGKTAAEQALDELRREGLHLKSLTLTAKDKICFCPEAACGAEECEFAKGYFDRIEAAREDAFLQDALTRDSVIQVARQHSLCPFEFSLELALWVDVIICDYNYAFDPRVSLKRFFAEEKTDHTFLIDEAHNLVDRAREMFSAQVTKQPFLDVRRAVRHELADVYRRMGQINSWLVRARRRCEDAGEEMADSQAPHDLYPRLHRFLKATEDWLSQNIKASYRDDLLDLYFAVSGFMRVSEQYDDAYVTCYQKKSKDLCVKLFCMDPAGQLSAALRRCRTAIFFSATMTPIAYFKEMFGSDSVAGELTIPSPFPQDKLKVLVADNVSTYYRDRTESADDVTSLLLAMVRQKTGNYLLFFPSYQYMSLIQERFMEQAHDLEVICQIPEMTEAQRDAFLDRFGQNNAATLVGFVVMGGIFGEGIDLVGERLAAAAIVGVGLPAICLERELIRAYFTENHDSGFEFAYLYPGINRVLQAAGRVIRSESDYGVITLIDSRFSRRQYAALFPSDWQPVRIGNEQQLTARLMEFWAGHSVKK